MSDQQAGRRRVFDFQQGEHRDPRAGYGEEDLFQHLPSFLRPHPSDLRHIRDIRNSSLPDIRDVRNLPDVRDARMHDIRDSQMGIHGDYHRSGLGASRNYGHSANSRGYPQEFHDLSQFEDPFDSIPPLRHFPLEVQYSCKLILSWNQNLTFMSASVLNAKVFRASRNGKLQKNKTKFFAF